MQKIIFLFSLVIFLTTSYAVDYQPYRINDIVGDTIDISEKEKYGLFPGISNFESAIFFLSDTFYLSHINYIQNDSLKTDTLQLTVSDVNRINHSINNADSIMAMVNRDQPAQAAYLRFWQEIESKHFNQRPKVLQSREGRTYGVATGVMFGSAVGGCVGSHYGIDYVGTISDGCFTSALYRVNYPVFCGINALAIGGGTLLGYELGKKKDLKYSPTMDELKEGNGWRIGLGIFSGVIGTAVGTYAFTITGMTAFGKISDIFAQVEGGEAIIVPALLLGTGIAYNITYWGYRLGKHFDHIRAVNKAKKTKK